jgi:hypothetical protein
MQVNYTAQLTEKLHYKGDGSIEGDGGAFHGVEEECPFVRDAAQIK